MGMMGQGNQGNSMMPQRPIGSYRPSQQGKRWVLFWFGFWCWLVRVLLLEKVDVVEDVLWKRNDLENS